MKNHAPSKGMTESEIAEAVAAILAQATLEEKVAMMSGRGFFKQFSESGNRWGGHPYRAGGGCERLGVPALYFTDGPRGVARGNSTCFPCSMARGAAFDVGLERRIGEIFGIEARAQDCTLSGAVCMNLLRHPAWGRAQETYGEDPHHLGEMGAALAQGIQTHNVVATVKHYALNSMENARFKVDVIADERTLHEVYLPHFKRALDAGCATVMSAYNKLNGEYCGENRVLLTDILRGEWGFDGFVHSDWVFGVHKQYAAAAGLDVENPEPLVFGEKLVAAVKAGAVEPQAIDQACRRILTVIYGKPVIVVIIAGSAVIVESWLGHTNAVLQTFYSGMEGGTALAKLLFGDVSPSGKLPFTVAKAEKDYPPFDKNADRIEYGYYHGYTLFEREGRAPRFPFGHGLSDTTFAYRALKLRRTNVEVTLSVANTGKVSADEVVLFYASFPAKAVDRPNRLLKAFARVSLAPGETKAIRREILLKDLMWRDATTHTWKLETGSHKFSVGTLAAAVDL